MNSQKYFTRFHKVIRVETEELREKRDILIEKIRKSLKEKNHPLPIPLNQGSYIYGVGVKPVGDEEYDIDIGLDFPIKSDEYNATDVRKWVYDAISDHTKNVEDRGPCIRVRYAAGYHVDLVIYARYKDDENTESYQLAHKDNSWNKCAPKNLKNFIFDSRVPFKDTKDSSGSDQLQRVVRFLKRWNDLFISGDSPDKPSGLATLLLVIETLKFPKIDGNKESDDLEALVLVATTVKGIWGRIVIKKPTPGYEDLYAKLNDKAMTTLKDRFAKLLTSLLDAKEKFSKDKNEEAISIIAAHFGDDFLETFRKSDTDDDNPVENARKIEVMDAAIHKFENPSKPWAR